MKQKTKGVREEKLTRTEAEYNNSWREGYDLGVQKTLRDNDEAIKIGRAILDVLDRRYEFKEEDY